MIQLNKTVNAAIRVMAVSLLPFFAFAQNLAEKESSKSIHIKWVQKKDGKVVELDTIIKNNPSFNVADFLKSRGFEAPEDPELGNVTTKNSGEGSKSGIRKIVIIKSDSSWESDKMPGKIKPDGEELEDIEVVTVNEQLGNDHKVIKVSVLNKISIVNVSDDERKLIKGAEAGDNLKVESIRCYPNPTSGKFRLSVTLTNPEEARVEVLRNGADLVFSDVLGSGPGIVEKDIDLSGNGIGTYFLVIRQGKKILSRKIVIDKE